jgi:NAD(P)H-hydrate epimerase
MNFRQIDYPSDKALELSDFKEMDYYAISEFNLPIELMMENAGLQLARLIASQASIHERINIGIGNGNNGGGGLVAARRLAAWGYLVALDLFIDIGKELPAKQLERARKFGVRNLPFDQPACWVDAYLGFSQRTPLGAFLVDRLQKINESKATKISLDLPTGFVGDVEDIFFHADKVLTLAAPKKLLYKLPVTTELYVADIGIPIQAYSKFQNISIPFEDGSIFKLKRNPK